MKKHVLVGFAGALLSTITAGALLGACSSSQHADGGFADSSGSGTTGSSSGAGGGNWGAGGSSIGGDEPAPPPLPPVAQDAGSDAPVLCDSLDKDKPVVLYLSADDSNSMSSPTYARELLRMGEAPPKGRIRTYEFLNYYRIGYPAPPAGQLSIVPALENTPTAGELDLQIGVRSFDAAKPRRPITVTFVLDTSGSMEGPGIERERAAAKAITQSLAAGDIVNMVTWNTDNNVILSGHQVTGPSDPTVVAAISALSASGGTDLHGGLVAGYQLAEQNYGPMRMNRMVLISDGGANVGITDENIIAEHAKDGDKEGIYLMGIGAGNVGAYNDWLMDTVTDKGRGAYVYLDSPEEAEPMFVQRFDETMEVAARSVQVELTLPWYFKIEKFYGEEYSEDPKQIEPQHLAPSDAMIFNQVLKACDPAVINEDDAIAVKVTWTEPLTYVPRETQVSMTVGQLLASNDKAALTKGKAIVAYAEALKAGTADALKAAADQVDAANPAGTDVELNEIASLLELHPYFP